MTSVVEDPVVCTTDGITEGILGLSNKSLYEPEIATVDKLFTSALVPSATVTAF